MKLPPALVPLTEDLRTLLRPNARLVDELECATSVALAILFAHLLHAEHVSWAAFSGYAVMRGHVRETLVRGSLRIAGTLAGAALGLVVVPLLRSIGFMGVDAIVAGLVAGIALYGAIVGRRAYAWLFFGLTFEMILLDTMEHPDVIVRSFAETRCLEVLAGTAACLIVSLVSTLTARRFWPAAPSPKPGHMQWHAHAFRHAAQGGVAVALLPLLWGAFHIPELAQSAITIVATMIVPLSSLGASNFTEVSRRLVQRVMGCVAGAILAAVVLFAADGSPLILILGTLNGVIVGRHLENGGTRAAYVGTQFVLAILVTLVPDNYDQAIMAPAIDRLTGIFVGILVLEPVLFAWHLFARDRTVPAITTDAALSE